MSFRSRARLVPIPAVSGAVPGGPYALRMVTVRETTGTATAILRIWNSSAANGVIAQDISLAPAESVRERYNPDEVILDVGVYIDIAAGAVEGGLSLQRVESLRDGPSELDWEREQ